ncbi:MAG: hypothetical protein Q9161_004364 [Pseudevernia consocians]
MSKRKHDEISASQANSNSTTARALRLQRLPLDGLLDQGQKSLFRSLKVARGFERQKLGRRQKTAKTENNATDTARLGAEVAALKSLDLGNTAETHLYKSLLKIKSIASAPAFPHHVRAAIDASKKPQGTASANVQARLFKSGPVQVAMTDALKGIRAVLGIEELKPNGRKRMRAKDYERGLSAEMTKVPSPPRKDERSMRTSPVGDESGGISSPPSMQENSRDAEGEDDESDYDAYASRLAGSSDEESTGEDAEGQDHDRMMEREQDDMSITDEDASEDESTLKEDPAALDRPPKPKHPKPPPAPPKSTTFLPSLSLGGYWSGSDSDLASNDNESSAAATEGRKNRMGQQARRALWEKKFGRNANHVKNRVPDRDQGWDARKGAREVDGRGRRGRGRGGLGRGVDAGRGGSRGGGRFSKSTGANSDPVVARKAQPKPAAEGPLHPSWEAARKAKEQKKTMPFQGKKVVFD